MRYTEIITEANYRSKFDTATTYKTDAEFKQHVSSTFGALQTAQAKESKPQAGGAVYIIDPNLGIVGYKRPNEDSPSGFVWYAVKEPFKPATKGAKAEPEVKVPAEPAKPAKKPVPAPSAAKAPPAVSLTDVLEAIKDMMLMHVGRYDGVDWRDIEPRYDNKDIYTLDCRHWGVWQVPDHVYGREAEDYDWEELSRESSKKMADIIAKAKAKYPTVDLHWNTGEKNWIYVEAKYK